MDKNTLQSYLTVTKTILDNVSFNKLFQHKEATLHVTGRGLTRTLSIGDKPHNVSIITEEYVEKAQKNVPELFPEKEITLQWGCDTLMLEQIRTAYLIGMSLFSPGYTEPFTNFIDHFICKDLPPNFNLTIYPALLYQDLLEVTVDTTIEDLKGVTVSAWDDPSAPIIDFSEYEEEAKKKINTLGGSLDRL